MATELDLAVKFQEPKPCTCDGPGPEGQHRWWCGDREAEEAARFVEPTVGGLTGTQLSLLHLWDDENRCEAEIFPVSPKGAAERCLEPKATNGSRFCEDHDLEPDYDSLNKDRVYGYDD